MCICSYLGIVSYLSLINVIIITLFYFMSFFIISFFYHYCFVGPEPIRFEPILRPKLRPNTRPWPNLPQPIIEGPMVSHHIWPQQAGLGGVWHALKTAPDWPTKPSPPSCSRLHGCHAQTSFQQQQLHSSNDFGQST